MIVTDPTSGREIDATNLTSGSDPTTPALEMDPARLAAAVHRSDRPMAGVPSLAVRGESSSGGPSSAELVPLALLERILARPYWHGHRTPEPVADAWGALAPHVDRLGELDDEHALLANLDRQDQRDAEEAAYQAIAAGKAFPKAKVVDRTAEREQIRAEAAARLRHLRALRRRYDGLVKEHAPAWRDSLTADYGTLKPAASVAWAHFRASYNNWASRQLVLEQMNGALDPNWSPYRSSQRTKALDAVTEAFQAVDRLMVEQDTNFGGDFVVDPLHIDPPVWQRREWFLSGDPIIVRSLALEEEKEGYRLTDFTRPGRTPDPALPALEAGAEEE